MSWKNIEILTTLCDSYSNSGQPAQDHRFRKANPANQAGERNLKKGTVLLTVDDMNS